MFQKFLPGRPWRLFSEIHSVCDGRLDVGIDASPGVLVNTVSDRCDLVAFLPDLKLFTTPIPRIVVLSGPDMFTPSIGVDFQKARSFACAHGVSVLRGCPPDGKDVVVFDERR